MFIKKSYVLEEGDLERIVLKTDKICDRQQRMRAYYPGQGIFEFPRTCFQRCDMFWVRCYLDNYEICSFVINPDIKQYDSFNIHIQYVDDTKFANEKDPKTLRQTVLEWFKCTEEYKQQCEWNVEVIRQYNEDTEAGKTEKYLVEGF